MRSDINQIIENRVRTHNELLKKASGMTGKNVPQYTITEYNYLKDSNAYFGIFSLPFFLTYAVWKDMENRIKQPYKKMIWHWKEDVDKSKAESFLTTQSTLLFDTFSSYILLLKSEKFLQALILFRSYIEYSSQFYACLLDYEFFKKYTESELLDDEYRKHWFKNLKPEKVLSRIREIRAERDRLRKKGEKNQLVKFDIQQWMVPFDTGLRDTLYEKLSGLAHGTYPSLTKVDKTGLYAYVFLCSAYLVQSHMVIDEICSNYFTYSQRELFKKWITLEIYTECRKPNTEVYDSTQPI